MKSRGFTLVELLVVIAIIGILSSVVLVSLNSARAKGRDSHIIMDIQQLRTLLESDYVANYNSSFVGSTTLPGFTTVAGNIVFATTSQYMTLFADLHNYAPVGTTGSSSYVTGVSTVANTPEFVLIFPSGLSTNKFMINVGTPVTAYAIYGRQSNGQYFCLDSAGNSLITDPSPFTITCQ